jgi:zinc protease
MNRIVLALVAAVAVACGGSSKGPTTPAAGSGAKPAVSGYNTAEQVIEASIAAQGGRDRLGKLTAVKQTGKITIAQMGVTGTMTAYAAPPANALLVVDLPGLGKIQQGAKDGVVWETNPVTGARIITGPERNTLLREAEFNGDLKWKQLYPKAELGGVVDWQGTQAYKVVLTSADGDVVTKYYSKETLLPVGHEAVVKTKMGALPSSSFESDYRDVQGIKIAHKSMHKDATASFEIVVESVELSPQLSPSTFDLPPEVMALQKKG